MGQARRLLGAARQGRKAGRRGRKSTALQLLLSHQPCPVGSPEEPPQVLGMVDAQETPSQVWGSCVCALHLPAPSGPPVGPWAGYSAFLCLSFLHSRERPDGPVADFEVFLVLGRKQLVSIFILKQVW